MEISTLMQSNSAVLILLTITSLTALRLAVGVYNFHEEYIVRRFLKRLDLLQSGGSEDSLIHTYLSHLKENEIFRVTTGINANTERSKLLMQLYVGGLISHLHMKRIGEYLQVENGILVIEHTYFDKFLTLYSLVLGVSIFIFGSFLGSTLIMQSKNIPQTVLGVTIFIIAAIITRFVIRDFKNYWILKRFTKTLNAKNEMNAS